MKGVHKYVIIIYFILLVLIFAFFSLIANAAVAENKMDVNVTNSGIKGFQTIEIICYGHIYSTNVQTKELKANLKKLEAWVDKECNHRGPK